MNCDELPHPDDFFVSTDRNLLDQRWLISNLLAQSWTECWTHERMAEAITNSLPFGLYKHTEAGKPDQMVGFARILTDGATYSLLLDVVIDAAFRKQGLAKFLVNTIVAHPHVKSTVSLLRTNTAAKLYEKFGYEPVGGTMRRIPVC